MAPPSQHPRKALDDPTHAFFEALDERGDEPLLRNASGTLRFDLDDGRVEHWHVTVSKGHVTVSRRKVPADTVVHASKRVFDDIVSGRANAMAAMLRGTVVPDGSPNLLVLFQRLFPGAPVSRSMTLDGREGRTR